jgi:hypothetical protein
MFGAAPFGWIYPAGMIAADIGAPVGPTIPVEQPGGGGGWGFESTRRKKPRNAFHFIQDLQFVDPTPLPQISFEHASHGSAVSEAVHGVAQPQVGMPTVVSRGRSHGSQSSLAHEYPQLAVAHESPSQAVSTHSLATSRYWTEDDDIALDDMMVLALASSYMDS